jgi:hypothetical protein
MITLAHARKSDIALHLMSKDHRSQPHLISVTYSSQDIKRAILASLAELSETSPGISVTEFADSYHVTVTVTYELPIVAEIIADYWSSHNFVVTRYSGVHNAPEEVETFLTATMKHRYAQGKYTYPYGEVKPDEELKPDVELKSES